MTMTATSSNSSSASTSSYIIVSSEQKHSKSEVSALERLNFTALTQQMRTEALMRKRKGVLRPILRGSLHSDGSKVIWSGVWALAKTSFGKDFGSDCTQAPFWFERTSLWKPNGESSSDSESELTLDGYYTGYFCMRDKASNEVVAKHFESNLLLRFQPKVSKSGKGSNCKQVCKYGIVGCGENKFGKFLLEGEYYAGSGELNCARNYLPNDFKLVSTNGAASLKLNGACSNQQSGIVCSKRSKRVKKPSERLRNFVIQDIGQKRKPVSEPVAKNSLNVVATDEVLPLQRTEHDLLEEAKLNKRRRFEQLQNIDIIEDGSNWVDNVLDADELKDFDPIALDPVAALPKVFVCRSDVFAANMELKEEEFEDSANFFNGSFDDLDMETELKEFDFDEEVDSLHFETFDELSNLDAGIMQKLNEFVEFNCPKKTG